jgi:hypothetical protein
MSMFVWLCLQFQSIMGAAGGTFESLSFSFTVGSEIEAFMCADGLSFTFDQPDSGNYIRVTNDGGAAAPVVRA